MKGSYSSRMLPTNYDTNKQNKSLNRRPSLKSGKNVIQQYANQSKLYTPSNSYHSQTRRTSPINSTREAMSNIVIVEESHQASEYTQSLEEKCKHYQSIDEEMDCESEFIKYEDYSSSRLRRVSLGGKGSNIERYESVKNCNFNKDKDVQINRIKDEVHMMKSKIIAKDMELSNIIEMHQSQVHSLTQKDQFEKNTLIKQIHNNHIQIQKLKDSHKILASEKESLNIYLKEKEVTISQLQKDLDITIKEKKELESHYESFNESKEMLKVVDTKLEQLIEDNKHKTKQLENNKVTIKEQNHEISSLKEKIVELNKTIKDYQERQSKDVEDLEDDVRRYKEEAIKLSRQLLKVPDLELRLKESQVSLEQYRSRISQLVENNDKMNVQILTGSGTERKIDDLEWQLGRVKKALTQTEGELLKVRGEFQQKRKDQANAELARELKELVGSVEAQSKQIEDLKRIIRENDYDRSLKEKQIEKLQQEINKLRERVLVMDELYKQNRNLTTKLKQKICTVEKLEILINDYQHRRKLVDQQCTEREMQSERMLHHTRELEEKCQSVQHMLSLAMQQKQNTTSRYEGIKAQLSKKIQLCEKVKQQLHLLREKNHQQQKLHLEEARSSESKYLQMVIQKKQIESSLEQQRQKHIQTRRKFDGSNQIIIKLNEEAVCKEEIIRTQNNNIIRLGGDISILKEECIKQSSEIQKMSKWKETYFSYMNEYSSLQKQLMVTAFAINQSD